MRTDSTSLSGRFARAFAGRRGLIAINAALLATLGAITFAPLATAQPGVGAGRARGQYTMVSGRTMSGGADAVYIIDSSNQELIALRWDTGKQSLMGLGYRNLSGDGATAPPGR
ncbi:MAG TPA: hypothetical protein VD997_02165 [Phycisphaerales bacterium]|nr:hypothetical protein [Phycisphaerales bacterium]